METIIFEHVKGIHSSDYNNNVGTLLASKEIINGMEFVVISASKFNPEIERSIHQISGNKIIKTQRFDNNIGKQVALDKAIVHAKKCNEQAHITPSWIPPMQLKESFDLVLGDFIIRASRYFPGTPIIIPVIKYKKTKNISGPIMVHCRSR